MLKRNVIVSNAWKHHAYEAALAMQKVGYLKYLYTSFYSKQEVTGVRKLVKNVMPERLKQKQSNRRHDKLDEKKVKALLFPEILYRLPPIYDLLGRYNIYHLCNSLFDIRVSLRDLRCDIFHGFEACSLYAMRAAKRQGAIVVLDQPIFHHEISRGILVSEYKKWGAPVPKFLYKQGMMSIRRKEKEINEADYVLVPTERIAADFRRFGKKTLVVPYGFNSERFSVDQKQDNIFRILFVGSIGFRKGVIYLLEAFKQLNLKNAELVLISPVDKVFEPYLKRYQGLFKHVHSVPNDRLKEYYTNSSVFVFPSLVEGSALSNYEAMACGLPIITTENSGSVVRDGVDGFIVPVQDVFSLKEKILFLYDNEMKRKEMGENAAENVKNFTWDRYYENLINAYNDILEKGK